MSEIAKDAMKESASTEVGDVGLPEDLARADLYGLIARFFQMPPDQELLDQIAATDNSILESIDGFDAQLVEELKNRAISYIENQNENIIENLEQLGVDVNGEYLYDFISKITNGTYPILYNNNPFTLTDLRDKLAAIKLIIDNPAFADTISI